MTSCDQCGKPAVYDFNGHPLCVDCGNKVEQAWQAHDRALKEHMNFLLDQAETISGIYGVTPRYKLPQPVIHRGPVTMHNIRVDRSVVGVINTGNIHRLETALSRINIADANESLQQDIKSFTETLLRDATLTAEVKNDIVEQLSIIAGQLAHPKESRLLSVMKTLAVNISTNLASSALQHHWTAIMKMLGI